MISNLFNFDSLSAISTFLILFISSIVFAFSKNYLRSDKKRTSFLLTILMMTISLIVTFCAENIILLSIAWMLSNLFLVILMIHKISWKQAVNSGILALKNFTVGFICLISAFYILHVETGSYRITEIIASEISYKSLILACSLILITALCQSAIYPFSSWLTSSLNSPTPASALMHAGLVNGGGIILARFSSLFFKMPEILTIAFILGILSAIIGTLWKLVQSNVKSMLACSTISQMGFMIAQCGMGLFPAAIAHLFWHGMFKSYLFLSSPSSWQEKRLDLRYPPKAIPFILSLICGLIGALIFAKINKIEINNPQTTLILVLVCFIAASQVALVIIGEFSIKNIILAVILSSVLSAIYAISVVFIERLMSFQLFHPLQLNFFHILAMILLFLIWLIRLFWINSTSISNPTISNPTISNPAISNPAISNPTISNRILLKLYVKILNSSQPKPETITAIRNHYNYK